MGLPSIVTETTEFRSWYTIVSPWHKPENARTAAIEGIIRKDFLKGSISVCSSLPAIRAARRSLNGSPLKIVISINLKDLVFGIKSKI
jgi:hypothetical protein